MTGAGPAQPSPAQPSPAQPPSIVQPRPGCGVVNRELRIPFEMYFHSLKSGAIAINGSVIIICSGAEEHSYRALLSIAAEVPGASYEGSRSFHNHIGFKACNLITKPRISYDLCVGQLAKCFHSVLNVRAGEGCDLEIFANVCLKPYCRCARLSLN